ncbi:MAG: peptide deformylase [bacterium]
MAPLEIIKYGHPILRLKAEEIKTVDDSIRTLADEMIATMEIAEGIGLAAPQVAKPLALCVVNTGLIEDGAAPRTYINPVILRNEGSATMEEGCLSIPEIREDVIRPATIALKYLDLEGVEHEESCEGMLARVLQHEIDHLNGVLFIDRISPMRRKLLARRLRDIANGKDGGDKSV